MTKLEKLKKEIGFTKVNNQCQNCAKFSCDTRNNSYGYTEEFNLKCLAYDFVVKKTTTCDFHFKKEN